MYPRWYNDDIMKDVNEKEKMGEDQRNEWYEKYFSSPQKADRRRNPGLKSRIVRAPTPDWIIKERMEQEEKFRNAKKPK